MPAIPTFTARNLPQGSMGIDSVDTGSQLIAKGISQFGSGLQNLASGQFDLRDANQKKQDRDDLIAADTDFAVFREQFTTQTKLMEAKAPLGVKDYTPTLLKDYEDQYSELLKKHSNPAALQALRSRGEAFRAEVAGGAVIFEANQGIKNTVDQVTKSSQSREKQVSYNPAKFATMLAEQEEVIRSANLPPDEVRKQLDTSRENLAVAAVTTQASNDPVATLRMLHTEPGKSGNAAIEALSPDGRSALLNFTRAELSRLVSNKAAADAASERAQRERHELGERNATLLLLRGKLTLGDLQRGVENDILDPTTARTLSTAMKAGDAETDPKTLYFATANVADLDPETISTMPGLSWKDRGALLEKREKIAGTWQDSNEVQEANRRIDAALGILPGTVLATLSDAQKQAVAKAKTALYNNLSVMPVSDRTNMAIPQAELVIQEIIKSDGQKQAQVLRNQLKAYRAKFPNPDDLSAKGKSTYQTTVDTLLRRIDEAESK